MIWFNVMLPKNVSLGIIGRVSYFIENKKKYQITETFPQLVSMTAVSEPDARASFCMFSNIMVKSEFDLIWVMNSFICGLLSGINNSY